MSVLLLLFVVVVLLLFVVRLAGVLVVRGLLVLVVVRRRNGAQVGRTTGEVDIDATGILLGSVLQPQIAADLFDTGLDFLDVVGRVVAFTDNAVVVSHCSQNS